VTGALARLIVRVSSLLAPRALRARWREEWLAELAARPSLRRALGAPQDALAARAFALRATARELVAGWGSDARQTGRALTHARGHAAAVVLCLSVGMIVSIGVFSILNAFLYGDLPGVVDRRSLVRIFISYDSTGAVEYLGRGGAVNATEASFADFEILERSPITALRGFAAQAPLMFGVSLDGRAAGTTGFFVSGDYFTALRTAAARGRLLTPDDNRPDAAPVAVISYYLWRDRFDARPDIVGQTLQAAGVPVTIVGVAEPRFTGLQPRDYDYSQIWLPLHLARTWPGAPSAETPWLDIVARLAPGATKDDARTATQAPAAQIAASHPDTRAHAAFVLRSHGFGLEDSPAEVLLLFVMFLSVPLSVLAIACANVANMQLARATRRSREIAVRLALGATRGQVVRLLTFDALLLASVAGLIGIGGARLALIYFQPIFPVLISLDWRVVAFAILLSGGATLFSGIAPAWLVARRRAATELRQTAQSGGLQHGRLRSALVVTQIALSLALLTICGLFTRTVSVVARDVPPSMREIVRAGLDVRSINGSQADAARLQNEVLARVTADTRVRAAALEFLTGFRYRRDALATRDSRLAGGLVTPGWVEATGARLLSGRGFTSADRADVALVNERLAREMVSEGTPPLGRTIGLRQGNDEDAPLLQVTIVGVITAVPNSPSDVDPDAAVFVPLTVAPLAPRLVVRTTDTEALTADIRQLVTSIEPKLPWIPAERADVTYLRDAEPLTYTALSLGAFGGIALTLAAVGLFAMMAYVVSLRTRELGIRVALGARSGDVVGLVVRQAVRLAVYGSIAGVAIAVPIAFGLRALLAGVSPLDPLALAPTLALLFVVAIAAAVIPARRAARVDPVSVLRDL